MEQKVGADTLGWFVICCGLVLMICWSVSSDQRIFIGGAAVLGAAPYGR